MKRMFDKKEIIDIVKEEGSTVTVDSELSATSENPVQNKVIYTALAGKEDSLPSTAEQTGKFLKVGSEGLEWAEAGGKLYAHYFSGQVSISTATVYIKGLLITNKSDAYTKQTLGQLLYNSLSNFAQLPVYVQINSGELPYIITDFRIAPVFSGTDVYLAWNEVTYADNTFTHNQRTGAISNFMDGVVEL